MFDDDAEASVVDDNTSLDVPPAASTCSDVKTDDDGGRLVEVVFRYLRTGPACVERAQSTRRRISRVLSMFAFS